LSTLDLFEICNEVSPDEGSRDGLRNVGKSLSTYTIGRPIRINCIHSP